MISKGTIRYIKSLQLKKYRKKAQSFLVEGTKSVLELLQTSFEVTHLFGTDAFCLQNEKFLSKLKVPIQRVNEKQLKTISALKTNVSVLAVAKYLPNVPLTISEDEYCLALDGIRDPGNLGTIIRIADWYGIYKLLCSEDCADFYHPKVIQSSMGSFTRVRGYYTVLEKYLKRSQQVYGATLNGDNVHEVKFPAGGVLLIGNESKGISDKLKPIISRQVSIPKFGQAESLNAAIATAVICDNIFRTEI